MTAEKPIACSLSPGDLQDRLAKVAAIGADGLIGHEVEGGRQLLRFRADAGTRLRLEEIVAAEARCCAFLDLDLRPEGEELVLTISAPAGGRPVAEELAAAFAEASR